MSDGVPDPEQILGELCHRTCIGAVAQPETKGDLLLHFADWQLYEPPNPSLLATERGKWSLMVLSPWRLDGPEAVVCDWRSVGNAEQLARANHLAFEGLRIEAINVIRPGNDLQIHFSRGHALKVLCDSKGTMGDCWYLLRPDDSSVAATRDFRLVYEPATPRRPDESG